MALSTYQQLQDSIVGWLWDRSDLAGRVPDFIALAEADFNSDLRVAAMEASASITLTSGSGSLPSDYLAWRRVLTQDSPARVLEWAEPNWAADYYIGQTAAAPSNHFTIIGTTIKTYPTSSANLTLQYYQKIPALASNTSGNWLLTRAPAVYLYGALMHAAPFLDDDDRLRTWGTLRNEAVAALKMQDSQARYSKAAARIKGYTP